MDEYYLFFLLSFAFTKFLYASFNSSYNFSIFPSGRSESSESSITGFTFFLVLPVEEALGVDSFFLVIFEMLFAISF